MSSSQIRFFAWLVAVLGLLTYYSFHVAKRDDSRLYYEVAGQTLGRPYNEQFVQLKREDTDTADASPAAVPARGPTEEGWRRPYRDFPVEYPPLALGIFVLPRLLTDYMPEYFLVFQGMMAGAFLGSTWLLAGILRYARPELRRPARYALVLGLVFLIGTGSYVVRRFDLLVSVTLALSIWAILSDRPLRAGVFLGMAAALKLWPVLLLPVLVLYVWQRGSWRRVAIGFGIFPILSHVVLMPVVGWSVFNYLGFHAGRGVQIESVWSSIMMLLSRVLGLAAAENFDHGSANLVMPSLAPWVLPLSYIATAGMLVVSYAVAFQAIRGSRGEEQRQRLLAVLLLLAGGLLITAKVLSPQYLFWLFPLAFALRDRRIVGTFLAAVVLTHLYFPGNRLLDYDAVAQITWPGILVLLARNGMLVWMVVLVFRAARRPVERTRVVEASSVPGVAPYSAG